MNHYSMAICAAMMLSPLLGCSGDSNIQPVSGTVLLDGKPLEGATILFTPIEGEQRTSSRGKIDANGDYELRYTSQMQGALVGQHLVQIEYFPGDDFSGPKAKIPPKFNKQSELNAEVTADGDNIFDFDLKSN